MKKIQLIHFVITLIAFASCKKENGSTSVLKVYTDSMDVFNFTYTNGEANAIYNSGLNKYLSFEHKQNYIKAIRSDMEVEYFLNSYKLPVRIVYTFKGGASPIIREANYYYKQGTKNLDSVTSNAGWDGAIKNKYLFVYNGENIEKVTIYSHYSYTTAVSESSLSYTYTSTPNVFRNSDPLLFIYTNPLASFSYHSLLFYFPKTFSASTFATGSHPNYPAEKTFKLHYSTNSDGKIIKEWYDGFAHPHEYGYGH